MKYEIDKRDIRRSDEVVEECVATIVDDGDAPISETRISVHRWRKKE